MAGLCLGIGFLLAVAGTYLSARKPDLVAGWRGFALVAVIGLVLRLTGIGWGLPETFYHQSFHPDETGNLNSVANTNRSFYTDYNREWHYNKGTLMATVWQRALQAGDMLGLLKIDGSLSYYQQNPRALGRMYLAGRLVVVAFSLLALGATMSLAGRLFGPQAAFLAGLFQAMLPAGVVNSHYMKTDVPAQALVVTGLALCARAAWPTLQRGSRRWLYGCLVLGLAVGCKYTMALALAPLVTLWRLCAEGEDLRQRLRPVLIGGAALGLGFLVACPDAILKTGPFLRGVIEQLRVQSIPANDPAAIGHWTIDFPLRVMRYGFTLPVTLLLVPMGALLAYRGHWRAVIVVAAWLVPYTLVAGRGWALVRYAVPMQPFVSIIIGAGAATALAIANRRGVRSKALLHGVVALLAVNTFLSSALYVCRMTHAEGRILAVEYLLEHAPEQARIGVIGPELYYNPPIPADRFRIVPVEKDLYQLDSRKIDYLAISLDRRDQDLASAGLPLWQWQFYQALEDPQAFSLFWRLDAPPYPGAPHDWRYPFPRLLLLKRERPVNGFELPRPEGYVQQQDRRYLLR